MSAKHYYPRADKDVVPFTVKGKGAWMSWVTIAAGLSGAFGAGIWANNLEAEIRAFQVQVSDLKEAQKSMQTDIAWLVREQGGHPQSKSVAVNP